MALIAVVLLTGLGFLVSSEPSADAGQHVVTTKSGVVTHGAIKTTKATIGWLLTCPISHRLPDDPIVHPGEHGTSHMHDFTGNASTNGASTYASMTAAANQVVNQSFNGSTISAGTSCDLSTFAPGTAADTGAYWRPSVYANGTIITPTVKDQLYYRAKPTFGTGFVAFPADARLIVGNHMATSVATNPALTGGNLYWECNGETSKHYVEAPNNCKSSGTESILENVVFPSCWDGNPVRHDGPLGSDNNQFAYASGSGVCPAGFAIKVPQLSEKFKYDGIPVGATIQLSSDPAMAGMPGMAGSGLLSTYTAHADFWNTWNQPALTYLVDRCINAQLSCGTNPVAPVSNP